MVISSRAIVAMGLCTAGLGLLVGPSLGQQPDGGVRRTANSTSTAAPTAPVPPVIGTIDLDAVFKNYEKVKVSSEEFQAAALARKNDLMKIQAEAQQEAEMLAKLTPGTDDFKKHENKVTELKARYEAGREQAERDFASREAEAMATLYKEIQAMVARVAQWRKMTYVVKVSNQPISGGNPNSVMAAMANTMVYADPRNDITNDVVYNLNRMYKATGGPAPQGLRRPQRCGRTRRGRRRRRPARRQLTRRSRVPDSVPITAGTLRPPGPASGTRPRLLGGAGRAARPLLAGSGSRSRQRPGSGSTGLAPTRFDPARYERTARECSPPSVRNARLPARRKCAGSASSTAPTSRSDSTRPSPTPASSSNDRPARSAVRSAHGSITSSRRSAGRRSGKARPRSR